jgi:putative transposase
MAKLCPVKYYTTSPEIIRLTVMLYFRFPRSLRNVEDLLHEQGVDIDHETARFWWHQFGPMFASEIRKRWIEGLRTSHWQWHLDEVFVKINGERHYLWRAVDHEGEVLESFVTKARDKKAALKFLKKAMRKHGRLEVIVTDWLRSYRAALKGIGAAKRQETGAGSTIELRIHTYHFEGESERCSASGAYERYRSSPQSTPQFSTISIQSVTSIHVPTSK